MAQSNACALLENGEPADNILARLDLPRHAFAEAYAGWQEEARPLVAIAPLDLERFVDQEIGGFIALTMGRYQAEARREFSDRLLVELADIPYSLLLPAITEARRRISYPERLVPFIFEFVEYRLDRLRAEGERLAALNEIVRGNGGKD